METRGLFYEQGSASYGHSELAKQKTMIKKMVFHSSSLVYGEQDFLDAAKNGIIFSNN